MRHIFIIDGGNAAEEFPFGSMLYSFSSTNGDHVNIQVCRRCKMNPCRCTMAEEKLLRTIKRKPVPLLFGNHAGEPKKTRHDLKNS